MFAFGFLIMVFMGVVATFGARDVATFVNEDGRQQICPPGSFCVGNELFNCPKGEFNDEPGQMKCKPCPVGATCGHGCVRPVFTVVDQEAAVVSPDTRTLTSVPQCRGKPGYFCDGNHLKKCAAGFFGSTTSNTTPKCDGPCLEGFYCLRGSSRNDEHPCPNDGLHFCPTGSRSPRQITGDGFYVSENQEKMCERGFFCMNGVRSPCPAGKFGNEVRLASAECSGNCSVGFYCPEGSTHAEAQPCTDLGVFCPESSPTPLRVPHGFLRGHDHILLPCPAGSFCVDGRAHACKPGTFKNETVNSQAECSICPAGYFCDGGSAFEPCRTPSLYCPEGSSSPIAVQSGHFTFSEDSGLEKTSSQCNFDTTDSEKCKIQAHGLYFFGSTVPANPETRFIELECDPGHFCVDGERFECPPGTFGSRRGETKTSCEGTCHGGYFCPAGSTSAEQELCPREYYCPQGTGAPKKVKPGFYLPEEDRSIQKECPKGHWCKISGEKFPCPSGTYGESTGLKTPQCSGVCPVSYFCPEGAIRPIPCTEKSSFCPGAVAASVPVSPGFYTTESLSWQVQCEEGYFCENGVKKPCDAGYYGSEKGLSSGTCSGLCREGFFCPAGSTNPEQFRCSEALGLTRDRDTFWKNSLEDISCLVHELDVFPEQFFEFSLLRDSQIGDLAAWNLAGTSGYHVRNTMHFHAFERGFYSNTVDEFLETGWRPMSGPKTACFWKKFHSEKITGLDGLFRVNSINSNFMLGFPERNGPLFAASGESPGSFAASPFGIYAKEWIFFCLASEGPSGSTQAYAGKVSTENMTKIWEQSDNGGEIDSNLSMIYGKLSIDPNRPRAYEDRRYEHSKAIYGGIIHWNAYLDESGINQAFEITRKLYQNRNGEQRKAQSIDCGAYPSNEWDSGFLGRKMGPRPEIIFRKDSTGNYKPHESPGGSIQQKDFEIPLFPLNGRMTESMIFCPEGSPIPKIVRPGFFTNSKRTHETICSPGNYCPGDGNSYSCPERRFGSEFGLISSKCSGLCPDDYMCPIGTEFPQKCPSNHFSPSGSTICIPCLDPAFCKI